eukprot:gene18472-biopygen21957
MGGGGYLSSGEKRFGTRPPGRVRSFTFYRVGHARGRFSQKDLFARRRTCAPRPRARTRLTPSAGDRSSARRLKNQVSDPPLRTCADPKSARNGGSLRQQSSSNANDATPINFPPSKVGLSAQGGGTQGNPWYHIIAIKCYAIRCDAKCTRTGPCAERQAGSQ